MAKPERLARQSGLFQKAGIFVPQEPRAAVYPGEGALLDVAIRADNDKNRYGWNAFGAYSAR